MRQTWTIREIERLRAEGKIRGFTAPATKRTAGGKAVGKHFKKAHPAKDWMAKELLTWCQERGIILYEEYNFNPIRRWRADWWNTRG